MSEFPAPTIDDWKARVRRETGADASELGCTTASGVRVEPLYVAAPESSVGVPGRAPYVRGASATPAPSGWRRCQRYEDGDLEGSCDRIRADVAGGIDAIWLRLDRAARLGLAVDEAPEALGAEGLPAHDVDTLAPLLAAASLPGRELWLDAGGNALPAAALALAAFERAGVDAAEVSLRWCADPLGALAADGQIPADHATLGWEAAALAALSARRWPGSRTLTASSAPYARAGAGADQQIGLGLATAIEYMRYLTAGGVAADAAGAQIALVTEIDQDFLVEVAKLRALRLGWSKLQSACAGTATAPLLHAATGWRSYAAEDPWVNMLRATVQTMAAAIGGAQTITALPFDAPLGQPEARGLRVARNTHAVLGEESRLGEVMDAAGGAYAVETLTDELARAGWEVLRRVDANGMASALVGGELDTTVRDMVEAAAAERRDRIGSSELAVLGVNRFPPAAEEEPLARDATSPAEVRAAAAERQARRSTPEPELALVREAVARTNATNGPDLLIDALVDAARAGATIQQLGEALRPEAVPQSAPALRAWRDAEAGVSD